MMKTVGCDLVLDLGKIKGKKRFNRSKYQKIILKLWQKEESLSSIIFRDYKKIVALSLVNNDSIGNSWKF